MKILVVSDTHRDYDCFEKLRKENPECSMYLHLGDSELEDYLLDGFISVKGNCDYEDYPISRRINTDYGDIFLEHGCYHHLSDEYIKSLNCLIFLSGHTHKHSFRMIGSTYVFNPGSLIKPRDGTKGTYLVITLTNNKVDYEFKELEN